MTQESFVPGPHIEVGFSPMESFAGLFLLSLVLILVGVGIFLLVMAARRGGYGATLGVLGALGFFGVLMLVMLFRMNVGRQVEIAENWPIGDDINHGSHADVSMTPAFATRSAPASIEVVTNTDAPVAAWNSDEVKKFSANLYPGLIDCAAPLARRIKSSNSSKAILPDVSKMAAIPDEPESKESEDETKLVQKLEFLVEAKDSLDSDGFQQRFVAQLRTDFPEAIIRNIRVKTNEGSPDLDSHQVHVQLSADITNKSNDYRPGSNYTNHSRGDARCALRTKDAFLRFSASFVDKPWVQHLDSLVSRYPDRHLLVGYSPTLASTESEARQAAMRNAQEQVTLTVNGRSFLQIDDTHVIDRFAQKLSRPYGDVWREAVLLDIDGLAMNRSGRAVATATRHADEFKKNSAAMVAILLVTTILAGAIANMMTLGYYRQTINWTWVAVSVIVIVVGAIAISS